MEICASLQICPFIFILKKLYHEKTPAAIVLYRSHSWFGAAVAKTRQSLRTVKSRAQLIFRNCSEQSKNQRRRVSPSPPKEKSTPFGSSTCGSSDLWQIAVASLLWTKVETVHRTVSLSLTCVRSLSWFESLLIKTTTTLLGGCCFWRRGRDSNPCAFWANGFQDRLVMTTSIPLRMCQVTDNYNITTYMPCQVKILQQCILPYF